MKVIKAGRSQKGWSKKYKCTGAGNDSGGCRAMLSGGCHAMLLVEQDDLFETMSSHYDGSTDYYTTFQCSQCGVLTDIKDAPNFTLPSHSQWKKMHNQEKRPLKIELSKEDIGKIIAGECVNRQIVSQKLDNAPLMDLEIVAEGVELRKDFSEIVDEAIEPKNS